MDAGAHGQPVFEPDAHRHPHRRRDVPHGHGGGWGGDDRADAVGELGGPLGGEHECLRRIGAREDLRGDLSGRLEPALAALRLGHQPLSVLV